MMNAAIARRFRQAKELKPFVLKGITRTQHMLGTGSFGTVEELSFKGTPCAGKKLHEELLASDIEGVTALVNRFVSECRLMSGLRHPNIVQFLGLCLLEDNSHPMLVMEKLEYSLESYLERNAVGLMIPLSLKVDIMHDVAKGLVHLHGMDPIIIHRDLTARNVLLTSSMQAKITDLGNARMVTAQQLTKTMSKAPGTLAYMPPEALTERPHYDTSLDVFSFGQLSLFTIVQKFPGDLLSPTYYNEKEELMARSEVQRRKEYISNLHQVVGEHHRLVAMIEQCLSNRSQRRPTAEEVMGILKEQCITLKKYTSGEVQPEASPIHPQKLNTPGVLEMLETSGALTKRRFWKKSIFEVTETHLKHNSKKHKDVLLSEVEAVAAEPSKDPGKFVFVLQLKGRKGWKLSAYSEEQRTKWMEAIKLGSSGLPVRSDSNASFTYIDASEIHIPSPRRKQQSTFSTPESDDTYMVVLSNTEHDDSKKNGNVPKSKELSSRNEPQVKETEDPLCSGVDETEQFDDSLLYAHPDEIEQEIKSSQEAPSVFEEDDDEDIAMASPPLYMNLFDHSIYYNVSDEEWETALMKAKNEEAEDKPPLPPKPNLFRSTSQRLPANKPTLPPRGSSAKQDPQTPRRPPPPTSQAGRRTPQTGRHTSAMQKPEDSGTLGGDELLVLYDDEIQQSRPDWAIAKSVTLPQKSDSLKSLRQQSLFIRMDALVMPFKKIGQGEFGMVYKSTLSRNKGKPCDVAIKTIKKYTSQKERNEFLREMGTMMKMMHPNIVMLFGLVHRNNDSPFMVMEYLFNGDLKKFLANNKRSVDHLVKYMTDVAMGMHYLSEKGLIHRDLAARNIMVAENEVCKVADFGLLRELPKDKPIYHASTKVPFPIRWMAPESIEYKTFSPASDVWSFGIVQWEMYNPTSIPYADMNDIEYTLYIVKPESNRLAIPREYPATVAKIMKACWNYHPENRPSFLLITSLLSNL